MSSTTRWLVAVGRVLILGPLLAVALMAWGRTIAGEFGEGTARILLLLSALSTLGLVLAAVVHICLVDVEKRTRRMWLVFLFLTGPLAAVIYFVSPPLAGGSIDTGCGSTR